MLGIDVSKDTLACTLLDPATKHPCWSRTVPNTPAGIARLLRSTPPATPWTLEPTGRYSHTVAKAAQHAGREVLLAEPRKAKHFLASRQTRAKTDRLDSYGLGLYALSHALQPYPLKSAMLEQLDQLLCARRGLSQSIASLQQRRTELPHAAVVLEQSVAALQQQRQELDRQIKQLTQLTTTASQATASQATAGEATAGESRLQTAVTELQKVPGIGPVVAATVVSRLLARNFTHSDQFVAYCGLDVGIRQSGKRNGSTGLTKQGDAELRRLLYVAAQANLRAHNSPFAQQYERERAKGLSSTAALCAVARKLARLCWSMVTHGSTYDPERIYQQPVPATNTKKQKPS